MKGLPVILVVFPMVVGCVAPINLTYESARTLRKGQVDVQGNYGRYYSDGKSFALTNYNYGAKVGYGLSDNHTIKLRYEHIVVPSESLYYYALNDFFNLFYISLPSSYKSNLLEMHYYEIDNKIRINEHSTFSIPIGYYSAGVYSIDLRYYLTVTNRARTFDATLIPKAHILIGKSGSIVPGLGIGFGISSDLDRWAFRPEVGWDGYFAFGGALTVNLSTRVKKNHKQ